MLASEDYINGMVKPGELWKPNPIPTLSTKLFKLEIVKQLFNKIEKPPNKKSLKKINFCARCHIGTKKPQINLAFQSEYESTTRTEYTSFTELRRGKTLR